MCINCSFVHLYLQFYYSVDNISYFGLYFCICFQAVFISSIIWFICWQFTLCQPFAQHLYNFSYITLFAPFVEAEYTLMIGNHLQPCWLIFVAQVQCRNGIISSSDLKSCAPLFSARSISHNEYRNFGDLTKYHFFAIF